MATFGTDEWAQSIKEALNTSEGYKREAAKWEGDFCFVCTAAEGLDQELVTYFDLWHGSCREAAVLSSVKEKKPAFTITAPLSVWKKVIGGDLDPIKGITSRQLKLKGNMLKVIKMPKAAMEMVTAATTVDTEWPA